MRSLVLLMCSRMTPAAVVGSSSSGIESFEGVIKCSACGAVSQELLLALEREILSRGKPSGQELDVHLSESRFLEIIDGVCGRMSKYTLVENNSRHEFVLVSTLGKQSASGQGGLTINHPGGVSVNEGHGFKMITGANLRLGGDEAARMTRKLNDYCEEVLGNNDVISLPLFSSSWQL